MKLRRLYKMGVTELACRGWQQASKSFDRLAVAARGSNGKPSRRILTQLKAHPAFGEMAARFRVGDHDGAAKVLLGNFRATAAGRFFEGAGDDRTPALLAAEMSGARERALAAAEAVCRKRFDVLGYRGVSFGDPVDWHLDPVSGRRAPLVHWSQIDPLDEKAVGDSKVIWELNRHQWFLDLGQAYRFTGDERYAETFAVHIREWMRANPPGVGINWSSSLEAAFRLISWSWSLFLFRGAKVLSPAHFVEILEWVWTHASHIERYLSYYFSPNTHLTGEALGLFYVGVVFPELPGAARWRTLGARILVSQAQRQVLQDGVYFEQSTHYQRYTVEMYLHFLILAARNGVAVPAEVGKRTQRMLDFLLALSGPDGSMPQIGDADGGSLLPLAHRSPDDFRGVFSTAAVFFRRADYAWAAGGLAPETLWLLGEAAGRKSGTLREAPPPSHAFTHGGYVVMRSGWNRYAHRLIFDVGPLGCPVSGGHGHADLLSIQCSAFGVPCLADPGTYCYTADPEWRDYFRSTAAHSAVMVDGLSQAVPAGPFAWRERPRARLRRWVSSEAFDLADADHDAYRSLPDPVTHRRRVFFAKPRYWVVVDDLEGRAEHRIELRFQFAPLEVSLGPDGWVRARGSEEGRGLLLRSFAGIPLHVELLVGRFHPARGWVSPDYGQRCPSPVLICSAATRLPLRITTLLIPAGGPSEPPPAVTPLGADGSVELGFENRRETVCIGEQAIAVVRE